MYNALFLQKKIFNDVANYKININAMPIFYVLHTISCKCDSFTKSYKYGVRAISVKVFVRVVFKYPRQKQIWFPTKLKAQVFLAQS